MTDREQAAIRRLQSLVLDLIHEHGQDIPPDKLTEIIASIRQWAR